MIPFPLPVAVPSWVLKLIVALVFAAGIWAWGYKSGVGHTTARWDRERDKVAAEHVQELERAQQALIAAHARAAEASNDYQAELERLRARPVDRRPVRLCREPARVPAAGPDPGRPGAPPASGGLGDEGTQPDIGPDLYALAARCDEVTAQARGLQSLR